MNLLKWHIEIDNQLWFASYHFSESGLSRSSLIKLHPKAYLVYSPGTVDLALEAKNIIPEDAELFLLAPNAYHTIGLKSWLEVFPKAKLIAASPCASRLTKKLGLTAAPISVCLPSLPSFIRLIELTDNRVGEVWISLKTEQNGIYWIVCDGFFNIPSLPKKGPLKWFMTYNRMGPGLSISRIFAYFAVKRRKAYREWLSDFIKKEQPSHLIPCHGKLIHDSLLPKKLEDLIKEQL